jgi:hypothetical protein
MTTSLARSGPVVEITFELPAHCVSVLDGYCQAHNLPRTTVFKELLAKWSAEKHREAIMICRTAGNNPDESGSGRD